MVNIQKAMENHHFFWGGGKSTISMAIFNSYVSHSQRVVRIFFNPPRDTLRHGFHQPHGHDPEPPGQEHGYGEGTFI